MGKRILVQRMGKGGSQFRAPVWRRVGAVRYIPYDERQRQDKIVGRIVDLLHDPGRGTPVALVMFEDGTEQLMVAPEGIGVGDIVEMGAKAEAKVGNVLPLSAIPDGTLVCNVEVQPGDGGKLARASGTYAQVLTHGAKKVYVKLPSGKVKELHSDCRATIGIVAGGGRIEKPFLKAGAKYHLAKVKCWKWPVVRGKAMNACSHPHGGGAHPKGSTPVSRNAPPGRKVGHIAARRTGRRKG